MSHFKNHDELGSVKSVALSRNNDMVAISTMTDGTQYWLHSHGRWKQCSRPTNDVFEDGLDPDSQHTFEGSTLHAQLTPVHTEALNTLYDVRDSWTLRDIRPVFNGHVVRRWDWPYFGLISIME